MSANVQRSENSWLCVVDDDLLVRESTNRLLRSCGFQVKDFASPEEVLDSDFLSKTGCLILDMRMPHMTGVELQRQLRSMSLDLPIIFITAYEDPDLRAQALEAGAIAFLYKPFDEQDLLNAINVALKHG
jgi:two-component system, LuxR family, response regulator FixJ